jgi:hypothetical protein
VSLLNWQRCLADRGESACGSRYGRRMAVHAADTHAPAATSGNLQEADGEGQQVPEPHFSAYAPGTPLVPASASVASAADTASTAICPGQHSLMVEDRLAVSECACSSGFSGPANEEVMKGVLGGEGVSFRLVSSSANARWKCCVQCALQSTLDGG